MSRTPFELFRPGRAALIVIDKQAAYADRELLAMRHRHLPDDFEVILAKLDAFIGQARKAGMEVIWTQMTEEETASPEPVRTKMRLDYEDDGERPVAAKPGNADYEIVGTARPTDGELVVAKSHYDSFSEASLDAHLRSHDIASVVLVGGFMPRCVLATAFGANSHDYHVLLLKDLCFEPVEFAPDTPRALNIIQAILGYVDTSDKLLDSW